MPLNRLYFLNYKSKNCVFLSIIVFFIHFSVKSQIKSKIKFQSANPFAMSDVINNLDKLDPQEVFGELTIPSDSLNNEKKISSIFWSTIILNLINRVFLIYSLKKNLKR